MTNRQPYTYIVLRYRHDPLAGEFANVGVVVFAQESGFLRAKMRHTLGRLARIFPDMNSVAFKDAIRGIESAINRKAGREGGDLLASLKDASAFALSVLPDDDTSFVWSPMGSGLTSDPVEALERLYVRFVGRYDEHQRAHRDDAAIWRPVRDRLAERNLIDRLQRKKIVSPVDHVEFEHAWKNGTWQCYQPLSFDLANEENIREKARRWAGHLLALQGASDEFRPYFLVGAPGDRRLGTAYQAALSILKLSPGTPEIFEESGIDDFVQQIEDEIMAHEQRD